MLSPGYLNFMVHSVGMILARGHLVPLHTVETNHVIMVALYMSRDSSARELFLHSLEEYGDFVCECWNNVYTEVVKSNAEGCKVASANVEDILRRIGQK